MKIAYQNHSYEVFEQNSRQQFIAMPNPTTYIVRHQNFGIAIDGVLTKNADGSVMCFEQPSRAIAFGICYIDSLCESERLVVCGINAANNDDAEVFFRKAIELNSSNSEAHWRLGACLLQQERDEEAEKMLRKALGMDLRHLNTYLFLGSLFLKTKRVPNAISMFKTALKIQPDSKNAQELLDLAVEWKNKASTSSPSSALAAITEKMHDDLEASLAAGDPKARDFVESTRAELNSARECMGRPLFVD